MRRIFDLIEDDSSKARRRRSPGRIGALDEAGQGFAGGEASSAHEHCFQMYASQTAVLPAPQRAVVRRTGDQARGFLERNEVLAR